MGAEEATKFEGQLPKPQKITFAAFFSYLAGISSILALLGSAFFITDPTQQSFVYLTFLSILVLVVLSYSYYLSRKKLHRYAQSVIFSHYASHIIRDALHATRTTKIEDTTIKVLNAVATCFSIITGKKCRACVIELKENYELKVMARDDISNISDKKVDKKHYLDDNTDFKDLWYAKNGCSRYFLSNNLPSLWHEQKYKNSSFAQVGEPKIKTILGYTHIYNWKLPYKSALVLPIRYISSFAPPINQNTKPQDPNWDYWGFLCIDCGSRNVFDDLYIPELGGAFADGLYTLYSQYEINSKNEIYLINNINKANHETSQS